MRRACLQLFRFSTQSIKPRQSSSITTAQQKFAQTPVYLRPYDKNKYQVPMKKIKKNSGYALLQIQPFPRARIMKICYNILEQVKIGIPQDFPDRIFIEQRTKYIMEMTDKIQDIQELEDFFSTDSIQLMIVGLTKNLQYIDICRKHKFWQIRHQNSEVDLLKDVTSQQSLKFPIYKKGQRPSAKFLD